MPKTKKKYNTFSSLLTGADFNISEDINISKQKFKIIVDDMELQQATGRYIWEGLPENIDGWLIENMLYVRGVVVGFFSGGQLKILPFANSGQINIYGIPTSVQPVAYNGTKTTDNSKMDIKLLIDFKGNFDKDSATKNHSGALLWDRIPLTRNGFIEPRIVINEEIRDLQAEIISRVRNNIRNSDTKVVFYAENQNQKDAFYTAIGESYTVDSPFIVLDKGDKSFTPESARPFHSEVTLQAQALFEAWQSLNNIRSMSLGILNGGAFEKKERVVTDEVLDESTQTNIIMNNGLIMRQLFVEKMKILYPQYKDILNKISVHYVGDQLQETKQPTKDKETEVNENEKGD